jgi:drug/metabolite transporter (DMT)-like permease
MRTLWIVLPLWSGLLYAITAMLLKRAMVMGMGPWRSMLATNLVMALSFLPLLRQGGTWPAAGQGLIWLQPMTCGLLFFVGQTLIFLAINHGDVSVAAPTLGAKVLLVAFFTVVLLESPVPLIWWLAAVMSTVAFILLRPAGGGGQDAHAYRRRFLPTFGAAFAGAVCFALCDTLVTQWAPGWDGPGYFLPTVFVTNGLLSLAYLPFFRGTPPPRRAWLWLLPATILYSVQAQLVAITIASYGHPTVVNILYSTRGAWTVVLVWLLGHWFHNVESEQGPGVMRKRLAGALLIAGAVSLVLSQPA